MAGHQPSKQMKTGLLKLIGVVILIVLIANLILFALAIITAALFWVIIILGALFVYKLLPKLKK